MISNRLETIMVVKNAKSDPVDRFLVVFYIKFLFFCCLTPCTNKCNNNIQKSGSLSYTLGYELPILTIQFPVIISFRVKTDLCPFFKRFGPLCDVGTSAYVVGRGHRLAQWWLHNVFLSAVQRRMRCKRKVRHFILAVR